ncbi:hypothetical protein AAG570_010985 [Ranatra chinensis]|uniref:Uncharacterized protein n=1 Tax=Ranatra chinensis TaxID=642074 RepID=A0ABD0Z1I8_9HEMI
MLDQLGSGRSFRRPVLMKRQPASLTRREAFRCDPAFRNEAAAYDVVLPALASFTGDRLPFPACLHASSQLLVLQDLQPLGYTMADRLHGLDLEHAKLALKVAGKSVFAIEISPFQSSVGIPRYSSVKVHTKKMNMICMRDGDVVEVAQAEDGVQAPKEETTEIVKVVALNSMKIMFRYSYCTSVEIDFHGGMFTTGGFFCFKIVEANPFSLLAIISDGIELTAHMAIARIQCLL